MSAYNPPFQSALFYAVQNEDYQTELAVLRRIYRGAPLRVLVVASAGETALSLLTQDFVAAVDAVDINPAQLHLCELRRTATEHLTPDEQLLLLGADPAAVGPAGAALRGELFQRLAPHLPEPARSFWEAGREREIAFGVQHVGRNEVVMHDLQERLRAAGFDPLRRPVADAELPAWQAVYVDLMTPAYIRDRFGLPSDGLAARIAGIAGYLGECHFRALQRPQPDHNPFLTTVFANAYAAGAAGRPLYLQAEGWAALRRQGTRDRLRLLTGSILDQMTVQAAEHGPYDLISLSNIADWLTDTQFGAAAAAVCACLRDGGALLTRTGTPSPMIVEVTGQALQMDPDFNRQLAEIERGPWFRTLAAGFRV
ncbi:MAG: DUF3419 family protein [Anaerolineales bacterium]|nr:DUF3419 family protein [Anaerolineales bacterium]